MPWLEQALGVMAGGGVVLHNPEDVGPTTSLLPIPVLIHVRCHSVPVLSPTFPWIFWSPPACSPRWDKLSSWGKWQPLEGTLICCP